MCRGGNPSLKMTISKGNDHLSGVCGFKKD